MTRWHPDQFEPAFRDDGTLIMRRTDNVEVCDFCLTPGPTWEYPAAPMEIVGHPLIDRSDDEWGACDECHRLIEAHNIGALVERLVKVQGQHQIGPDVKLKPLPLARREARQNILRFMDARLGPAREYRP